MLGLITVALLLTTLSTSIAPSNGSSQTASPSVLAGGTGLTAMIVATSHEVIKGQFINASGYDVGIYIGPGTTGVKIIGVTVVNANDHGIFVQDASNIMIKDSTVKYTGFNPTPGIAENKAIELVGTSNSFIIGNIVEYNMADGGIGIADDGPFLNPGAPVASAAAPIPATHNLVKGNFVLDNAFGCGIVVASYNADAGVAYNTVLRNTVLGGFIGGVPYVGGIVVAADTPNTSATHNQVINNVINGSLIPGIVVHSNAPGDVVTGTIIIGNSISNNGVETETGNEPPFPTGIMVVAETFPGQISPPTVTNTFVLSNTISDNYYGIWLCSTMNTKIHNLNTQNVAVAVENC